MVGCWKHTRLLLCLSSQTVLFEKKDSRAFLCSVLRSEFGCDEATEQQHFTFHKRIKPLVWTRFQAEAIFSSSPVSTCRNCLVSAYEGRDETSYLNARGTCSPSQQSP